MDTMLKLEELGVNEPLERFKKPNGSTRPRSKRLKKIALRSTDGRKRRMHGGRSRRRSWKQLCDERMTR